jgi:transcriptional regulator with XRE-family HTH domain
VRIVELLAQKGMSRYRLSKDSGVPQTTVTDICSGKAKIENCSGETLYRLARVLGVTVEVLVEDAVDVRPAFETFKSSVCHSVKDTGDIDFIINTYESGKIRRLWEKRWYPESLYLLAMVDYLSRENGLPLCADYADIRAGRLTETLYPVGILILCEATHSDDPKIRSLNTAIPEFVRFNIVENEVRNVC